MRLVEKLENLLEERFAQSMVIDSRGDGHHVEVIAVDDVFEGKNRLARSRYAFEKLDEVVKKFHAITVKCFTLAEWEEKKKEFSPTQYVHLR